jgi:Tol biopolymer transport system component
MRGRSTTNKTRLGRCRGTEEQPATGIYVMDADGSAAPTRLTAGAHDETLAWSPDGQRIAFLAIGTAASTSTP